MSAPKKSSPSKLLFSKQEDCLRELKAAGAKPWHLIAYGWLNFAVPSMFRSLMGALVVLGTAYIGVMNR
jgi:hypothetical protein